MKTTLLAATLILLSPAAFAQTQALPPPGPPPAGSHAPGPKFAEHKAKVLAMMQQKVACIQAAQDWQAMEACRPKHPEQGGPGHGPAPGGGFPGDK